MIRKQSGVEGLGPKNGEYTLLRNGIKGERKDFMPGVLPVGMDVVMPHRKASLEPELHEHPSAWGFRLASGPLALEETELDLELGKMRVIFFPVLPGTRSFINLDEVLLSGAGKRTARRVNIGTMVEHRKYALFLKV